MRHLPTVVVVVIVVAVLFLRQQIITTDTYKNSRMASNVVTQNMHARMHGQSAKCERLIEGQLLLFQGIYPTCRLSLAAKPNCFL